MFCVVRSRVFDDLEALERGCCGVVPAIFGADVKCRILGGLALGDGAELPFGVVAEEDVVVDQFWPLCLGGEGPDPRREAAGRYGGFCHCRAGGRTQQTRAKGAGVAVEYSSVDSNPLTAFRADGADPALLDLKPLDGGSIQESNAQSFGEIGQRFGQPVHAALDPPDARGFGVPDQLQHGRRKAGVAADIGGVAPEQLP